MSWPIVLIHGFTGSPASWDRVVAFLPPETPVVRVSLFGHDPSIPLDSVRSFEEEVDRIDALLSSYDIRHAHLCGYSLGARVALGLLARHPYRFARATLIGVHPGLSSPAEREERLAADERWCRMLRAQGLEAFLAAWEAQPIFATQAGQPAAALEAQRSIRRGHDPEGLIAAMRVLGLGRMPGLEPSLETLVLPVCLMAGAFDKKFRAIAAHMAASLRFPTLRFVAGAGHNVPLEQPRAVAAALVEGRDR